MLTNEETAELLEIASDLTAVAMECPVEDIPGGMRDDLLAIVGRVEYLADRENERHRIVYDLDMTAQCLRSGAVTPHRGADEISEVVARIVERVEFRADADNERHGENAPFDGAAQSQLRDINAERAAAGLPPLTSLNGETLDDYAKPTPKPHDV